MTDRLLIDVVSDPVCPWCFVGLKTYQSIKPNLDKDFEVLTRFRPYQLNPDTPVDGADRVAYYAKKFPDASFRDQMRERLMEAARASGAEFDPMGPTLLPNTLAAHRLLRWAHPEGCHEALADCLYTAFWKEEADIGNLDILADLARTVGLDGDQIRIDLEKGVDHEVVSREGEALRAAGVNGVPTYIVNEKIGFSGALPSAQLEDAIRQAVQQA